MNYIASLTVADRLPARSIVIETTWTVAAVAVLVVLGKGIAALGSALELPNACWQLLALRAAAGAGVIAVLTRLGRGQLALFGVMYAGALMLSHTSAAIFIAATLAGLAAGGVRWALREGRYSKWSPWAVGLVFVVVLSGSTLYRKLVTQPPGTAGMEWVFDLGIRVSGAVGAIAAVLLVVSYLTRRRFVGV